MTALKTKSIVANIPARTGFMGRELPPRTAEFKMDEKGQWFEKEKNGEWEMLLEDEVIDTCSRAINWKEIRIANFPMHGFHQ